MPSPHKTGTGFVGLGQYIDANSGTIHDQGAGIVGDATAQAGAAQAQADGLAQQAYGAGAATGNADPTTMTGYGDALAKQQTAVAAMNQLRTGGGIANALGAKYGQQPGGYTAQQSAFDARLYGHSPDMQAQAGAAQKQYGGLSDYLQSHTTAAANAGNAGYVAPGTPPTPAGPQGTTPGAGKTGIADNPWKQDQTGRKLNPHADPGGFDDGGDIEPRNRAANPWTPTANRAPGPKGGFGGDGTTNDPGPQKQPGTTSARARPASPVYGF